MNLTNKTILVTGANRGIGKALVAALLGEGVAKIYAAARNANTVPDFGDARVEPISLDITRGDSIEQAAATAGDVDVLINNAGVLNFGSLLDMPRADIEADFTTNFYGTLDMARRFVPVLEGKDDAAIVNLVSMVAFVNFPAFGGYSASKAALFSASQGLRIELAPRGIAVHTVNPGPIDTDMTRDIEFDKSTPEDTAAGIVAGLKNGEADIFPDAGGQQMIGAWRDDYRGLEKMVHDMHHAG